MVCAGFERQKLEAMVIFFGELHSNRVKCADSLPRGYGTLKRFLIILEYFNAIQGCVIDTMLSLFLGTAKQNILPFML